MTANTWTFLSIAVVTVAAACLSVLGDSPSTVNERSHLLDPHTHLMGGRSGQEWIDAGDEALAAKDFPLAKAIYERIADELPTNSLLHAEMLCNVAFVLITCHDFESADKLCQRLQQSEFNEIRGKANCILARMYHERGDYAEMRKHLEAVRATGITNNAIDQFIAATAHLGPWIGVDLIPLETRMEPAPPCGGILMNMVMAFSGDRYLYSRDSLVYVGGTTNLVTGTADGFNRHQEHVWGGGFVNGRQQGTCTWFYRNGAKMCEGAYTNGIRQGTFVTWWPSGTTNCLMRYVAGQKHGTESWFRKDGSLCATVAYQNGQVESFAPVTNGVPQRITRTKEDPEQAESTVPVKAALNASSPVR